MVVFERADAARILLSVEANPHLAARHLRHVDRSRLFFDSRCSNLLCSKKTGYSIQLDVRLFWRVHRCMWCDARNGCVDSLGSLLLVFRRGQGDYRLSLSTNGNIPRPDCARGIESPQSRRNEGNHRTTETPEGHFERKRGALSTNGRQYPRDILDDGSGNEKSYLCKSG